jgi:hypothetical protein
MKNLKIAGPFRPLDTLLSLGRHHRSRVLIRKSRRGNVRATEAKLFILSQGKGRPVFSVSGPKAARALRTVYPGRAAANAQKSQPEEVQTVSRSLRAKTEERKPRAGSGPELRRPRKLLPRNPAFAGTKKKKPSTRTRSTAIEGTRRGGTGTPRKKRIQYTSATATNHPT